MDGFHATAALAPRSDELAARDRRTAGPPREVRADFERELDRTQRARMARRERARAERRERASERDRASDRLHGPRSEPRDATRSRAVARTAPHESARVAEAPGEAIAASASVDAPTGGEDAAIAQRVPRAPAHDAASSGATDPPTIAPYTSLVTAAPPFAGARSSPPALPRPSVGAAPRGETPAAEARPVPSEAPSAGAHERAFTPAQRADGEAPARAASTPASAPPAAPEPPVDLATQIRLQFAPGAGAATIQLAPASLGRVTIRIAVERGRVRAELVAERREALAGLAREVGELRRAFASHGLEVDEIGLSLAPPARALDAAAGIEAARDRALPKNTSLAARIARAAGVDTYA